MRYNVENGILKPDFMQFPPRDFKCFNFCLNKLTQGIMNQAQNPPQLKPKPEEQPPRIYNNTNIMINNNYLPPPGVQRPMGFPNPMLASPSITGISYAKQPPLKKSLDPPPILKQVPMELQGRLQTRHPLSQSQCLRPLMIIPSGRRC